jgi:sarcosine oxidase subunit alpha
MPWIVKKEKPDFVGKWAVELVEERGIQERLVGFTMDDGVLPPEGAQVVENGKSTGRVTSSRVSEQVGKVVGLAWVRPDRADDGTRIAIRVGGGEHPATVTLAPFYDPEGTRLRS